MNSSNTINTNVTVTRKLPNRLFMKDKGNIEYSLRKCYILYDIVAEGEIIDIKKIKDEREIDSHIINKGVFGKPLLVLDTFDTLEDAKEEFRKI